MPLSIDLFRCGRPTVTSLARATGQLSALPPRDQPNSSYTFPLVVEALSFRPDGPKGERLRFPQNDTPNHVRFPVASFLADRIRSKRLAVKADSETREPAASAASRASMIFERPLKYSCCASPLRLVKG